MMKKILASSLLGLTLIMSGCGDSEGESVLETQQMLDKGDFAGVIAKLEASASTPDDYINLGSAYMGKAGLTLTNIITAITSGGDDNSGDSGFAIFVNGISSKASSSAISDLKTATKFYKKIVDAKCLNPNANLSVAQKDVCLFIGLASTSTAAVTIDLIADDISTFGDGSNGDDKLTASTCALNYAYDRNSSGCSIVENSDVNFTIINKIYKPLAVTVNADASNQEYYYLMNDANTTVLTNGYCKADNFSRYEDINATDDLYACPINETPDAEETTTAGVLVDVLNDGLGATSGAASEDMQGDIDEFKCEILNGAYDGTDCNVSLDNNVSEQDIIDYLNAQN